jgi:hypothetical protein
MADYDSSDYLSFTGNTNDQGAPVYDPGTDTMEDYGSTGGDYLSFLPGGTSGFSDILKGLGGLFTGTTAGRAGQFAAFGGLSALLNRMMGDQQQKPVGYQGGIPKFTYERTQTPLAEQRPTTTGPDGKVIPYRPGQGGISYFTPGAFRYAGYEPKTAQEFVTAPATTGGGSGGGSGSTGGGSNVVDQGEKKTINSVAGGETPYTPGPLILPYPPTGGNNSGVLNDLASILNGKTTPYGTTPQQDYSGFGFDQTLVDYLNKQRLMSASDAGVDWTYDPNTKMFNGITMGGPVSMSLSDMKQAASGALPMLPTGNNSSGMSGNRLTGDRLMAEMVDPGYSGTGKTMAAEDMPTLAASGGYMPGGIAMLARGRYLKGNGDGVSDSIPARFAGSGQEARLADGEFVIPARVVSELGNGSSDAGARKLYAMLDRVEAQARKAKRGKPSGADRELKKLA